MNNTVTGTRRVTYVTQETETCRTCYISILPGETVWPAYPECSDNEWPCCSADCAIEYEAQVRKEYIADLARAGRAMRRAMAEGGAV